MSDAREEAISLYGLPREEFTKARNERAKELRAGGEGELAEAVKGLEKPDQVAAAINQAVRSKPKLRDELLRAGERLREASAGGGPSELREAMSAERRAVDRLVEVVRSHIGKRSRLDDAALTLHATSSDDGVRERFRDGRLTARATPSQGLGLPSSAPASSPRRPSAKAVERAREAERKARAAQKDAEDELRAAQKAVTAAQKELRKLETRQRAKQAKSEKAREAAAAAAERARELAEG